MIKDLNKTSAEDTLVGENVQVTGKLHTSGNIQINGSVKGDISSDGSVVIGKTATINGPISASNVKVEGTVKGNITASTELELDSEAKVFGDIQTKNLTVKSGAIFVGKSIMGEEAKEKKEEGKKKKPEEKERKAPEPELEIE